MSLTLGTGPLGTKPAGDFNFSLDGAPAHRIYFEPYPRRVRAMVGDKVVLDSVRGRLLYESNLLPVQGRRELPHPAGRGPHDRGRRVALRGPDRGGVVARGLRVAVLEEGRRV